MGKVGVILGHARSGSSELARAVGEATGRKFLMEPFHKSLKQRDLTFESPGFPAYLDEVMATKHRLIKHMWNGLTEEENAQVLSHPNIHGVVFIYRRDTVAAGLSNAVARMTGTWRGSPDEIPKPLPLDYIAKQAAMYDEGQRKYREWLSKEDVPYMALAYEDLYIDSRDERESLLKAACDTLGLPIEDLSAGADRLDPGNRYHPDEFYKQAPNWDEFVERFGDR